MLVTTVLLASCLLQPPAADGVAADKQALLGEWDFPPIHKGGPEVSARLQFGAKGRGLLTLRRAAHVDRRPFAYTVTLVGDERVIVAKGEAFPEGTVLTYRLVTDKVLFFAVARIPSPWLDGDRGNVAGAWFRPELKVR